MTDPTEVGGLARALITTGRDFKGVAAILGALPDPFTDGAVLIATLAFVAAELIDAAATGRGQTPEEFRAEDVADWARKSLTD